MGADPGSRRLDELRFDPVVEVLHGARRVCVLTGSGISAQSGVPTFRDAQQGLWAKYDPLELATPEAFARDPALVWRWYRWRRQLVTAAEPNAGHRALVELARHSSTFTLITQNVDGLHQLAGSREVVEFHGNLFKQHCVDNCGFNASTDGRCIDNSGFTASTNQHPVDEHGVEANRPAAGDGDAPLPRCPACGALVRPSVVWFGEAIPDSALEHAFRAVAGCDVFLSVGTSSQVYPAAGLVDIARQSSAVTVEINPEATGRSADFDRVLTGEAGTVLPELVESLARHDGAGET